MAGYNVCYIVGGGVCVRLVHDDLAKESFRILSAEGLEALIHCLSSAYILVEKLKFFVIIKCCHILQSHWVLPWSRYKKVLFDFLVPDFFLLR